MGEEICGMETVESFIAIGFVVGIAYFVLRWYLSDETALNSEFLK